jgi:hypothetical protein
LVIPDSAETDLGLKHYLAAITSPTKLYLSSWKITNAGLKQVAKLQKLTSIYLNGCKQITDAGVAELKKALPKCEINR